MNSGVVTSLAYLSAQIDWELGVNLCCNRKEFGT